MWYVTLRLECVPVDKIFYATWHLNQRSRFAKLKRNTLLSPPVNSAIVIVECDNWLMKNQFERLKFFVCFVGKKSQR